MSAYTSGRLDWSEHEVIERHVDGCATCQAAVETLDGRADTQFAGLAGPPGKAVPDDPQLQELIQRAAKLANGAPGADGADAIRQPEALPPGTRLGSYVLEELIGGGGMGRVYRARHSKMKREVAVKLLAAEQAPSPEARLRFQREVETAARLQHPHIVAAYDAGEADGHCYLVLEHVPGENLEQLVRRQGPLDVETALDYVVQAARGLDFAHRAGVVHRDVKPANLLLDEQRSVKVLDMGLARAWQDSPGAIDLTHSGMMMGTAGYLAPEQAADPRDADPQADVYGLGCTLYFLLTGRPPYEGQTAMQMVFAHRERPVPSLRATLPQCPGWVDELFQRMAAKRREDRVESAAAVIEAIEARGVAPRRSAARARRRAENRYIAPLLFSAVVMLLAALLVPAAPRQAVAPPAEADGSAVSQETGVGPPPPAALPKTPAVEMVALSAGEFWMGAVDDDETARPDEKPRHRVKLTQPFLLGRHEVTVDAWREVMGELPRLQPVIAPPAPEKAPPAEVDPAERGRLPVAGVSWLDAVAFCNALSRRHGLEPFYKVEGDTVTVRGGDGFRLPTEAEWEYACRAGTATRWHFGDDAAELDRFAWHAGNAGGALHAVGTREPNVWGLFDMHGNAPEWCWDRYDAEYYQHAEPINPPGSTRGTQRVFRGGSVSDRAAGTTSSVRNPLGGSYGGFLKPVGFRVARNAGLPH